jgi:hypothetical protein
MEFVRKGRGKFHRGDFTIVRPSGRSLSREPLALIHAGRDYNWRFDDDQLWLLDDEREVGYANGTAAHWDLLVADRALVLDQARIGTNHSTVSEGGELISEVGGGGFPLKVVELNRSAGLTEEEQAFVIAVALLGWREADRAMISSSRIAER